MWFTKRNYDFSKMFFPKGTKHATRLSAGSLLDDGLWHNVIVSRKNQTVKVSVDGVSTIGHIPGDFAMLNLDHRVFVNIISNHDIMEIKNLWFLFTVVHWRSS